MIITVISDCHIPSIQSSIPSDVINSIQKSNMILGLGDFIDEETVCFLKGFSAPFYGVLGNSDRYELRSFLPLKRTMDIEGINLFMTHGWGARDQLDKRIYKTFSENKPNICFFGHTHAAQDKMIGKTRFINPGTCRQGGSFAVLTINPDDKKVSCVIKKIVE
jgi:putative phosphoesterase